MGLLFVYEAHVVRVEAPEINEFAGSIDFGLEHALGLVEHAGGVHAIAPRPLEQLGGLEHHGRPVLPGHFGPILPGFGGGLDRHADFCLAGFVIGGEDMPVVVGADRFAGVSGADFLAADDERDFDLLAQHFVDFGLERGLFRSAGGIRPARIVDRWWDGDYSIGHDDLQRLCYVVCGARARRSGMVAISSLRRNGFGAGETADHADPSHRANHGGTETGLASLKLNKSGGPSPPRQNRRTIGASPGRSSTAA